MEGGGDGNGSVYREPPYALLFTCCSLAIRNTLLWIRRGESLRERFRSVMSLDTETMQVYRCDQVATVVKGEYHLSVVQKPLSRYHHIKFTPASRILL